MNDFNDQLFFHYQRRLRIKNNRNRQPLWRFICRQSTGQVQKNSKGLALKSGEL
ncbi:hypothetical protein V5J35_002187 [Endozoicomonas sp. NE40]|uniref:Uncharacterized protein n=1 Tax=Endozoicomonas lisbonensis TaxID=3120522 RepID=A0ABV2SGW7_9GAMM